MFQNLTPITRNIIFINIGLFILSQIVPSLNDLLSAYFPLSPNFYTWQIISHMFMHGEYSIYYLICLLWRVLA